MVNIHDRVTCLFWEDLWNNRVLKSQFPELFSFAKNPRISLRYALDVEGPEHLLHLPISDIALQQLTTLAQDLSSLQESSNTDIWSYIWGSPFFSSSKAYTHLTGHRVTHIAFKWLWDSACQNKHKVFFWLLLHDRLSTRNCLKGEIWFFLLTPVSAVTCLWKNPCPTFFSIARLHGDSSLPLV